MLTVLTHSARYDRAFRGTIFTRSLVSKLTDSLRLIICIVSLVQRFNFLVLGMTAPDLLE